MHAQRGLWSGCGKLAKAMASNPSSLKVTKVWPLEKYARFIPEEHGQVLPQKESTQKKAGNWKVSLCQSKLLQLFQAQLVGYLVYVCIVMWYLYTAALSVFKRVLHTDESSRIKSPHDIQWDTSLRKFMLLCGVLHAH